MNFTDLWSHTGWPFRALVVLGGLACIAGLVWGLTLAFRAVRHWRRGELVIPLAAISCEGASCPVHALPARGACARCGAFVCESCSRTAWCGACLERGQDHELKGEAAALAPGIMLAVVGMACLLQPLLLSAIWVMGAADGSTVSSGYLDLMFVFLPPLVSGLLMTVGGVQMARNRSYGLAIAGGVAAVLPLSLMCWLGSLSVGAWALYVLCRADVRTAFAAHARRG